MIEIQQRTTLNIQRLSFQIQTKDKLVMLLDVYTKVRYRQFDLRFLRSEPRHRISIRDSGLERDLRFHDGASGLEIQICEDEGYRLVSETR